MKPSSSPTLVALVLLPAFVACGGSARPVPGPTAGREAGPEAATMAEYEAALRQKRSPANEADVRFMVGMIPHHAQAVLFAGWAESHGAGPAVAALCERIVVGQRDEIRTMRTWLGDHGQPVPPGDPGSADTRVGMHHHLMVGMLTGEQLDELDAARGPEFDRLFLTYMIPHHQGALTMVDELFASYGGAQDDFVYKVASDIFADQTIEIERMQAMLDAISESGGDAP